MLSDVFNMFYNYNVSNILKAVIVFDFNTDKEKIVQKLYDYDTEIWYIQKIFHIWRYFN